MFWSRFGRTVHLTILRPDQTYVTEYAELDPHIRLLLRGKKSGRIWIIPPHGESAIGYQQETPWISDLRDVLNPSSAPSSAKTVIGKLSPPLKFATVLECDGYVISPDSRWRDYLRHLRATRTSDAVRSEITNDIQRRINAPLLDDYLEEVFRRGTKTTQVKKILFDLLMWIYQSGPRNV